MDKLISVIIPVYNCEKYVENAVESILRQPYNYIDIILVNDGSTDNSPEVCDSLATKNEHIHVIHQKNAGVSAARNHGISYALKHNPNGYIAFLDADDCWIDDFFTPDILELFKQNYDMLMFQSARCDSTLHYRNTPPLLHEGICAGLKSVYNYSHICATFFSCSFIQHHSLFFKEGLKYSEDKIFLMKSIYFTQIAFAKNKLLHLYRNTPVSAIKAFDASADKFKPIIDCYLELDQELEKFSTDKGVFNEGKALAAIYILDMIKFHFINLHSKRSLRMFFDDNNYLVEHFEHPFVQNYKYVLPERLAEMSNMNQFVLKCYVSGAINFLIHFAYNILQKSPLKTLIDRTRYPIKIEIKE